jgi:hypothetical protein
LFHSRKLTLSSICTRRNTYKLTRHASPVPSGDFLSELSNTLAVNDCHGMFGVYTLAEDDWTELSIGNSSVVIPSNGQEREEYIPVAFAFDDKKPDFRVHGKCGTNHKHTSKPGRSAM